MLYNAIIQPYLDYCSPLWDNCGIGLKDKLQKFQNRAARVITGATYDIQSSDILENLNWKALEERRNYLKSTFIYKILNGHTTPNLKEAFRFNNERDIAYNLRSRETDLAQLFRKKNSARGASFIMVPRIGTIFPMRQNLLSLHAHSKRY